MKKKILVLGGNGFIGRHVCEEATKEGHEVTSISRRGEIISNEATHWKNKIKWLTGSANDKTLFSGKMDQFDAVVHCIGILVEGKLNRFLSKSKSTAANLTYEQVNRDTALVPLQVLAEETRLTKSQAPKPFIFVSAAFGLPFLKGYLSSKHEVENKLMQYDKQKKIRPVIIKPGVVYDSSKFDLMAKFLIFGHFFGQYLKKKIGFSINIPKPTSLKMISETVLQSIESPTLSGEFDTAKMELLTENHHIENKQL